MLTQVQEVIKIHLTSMNYEERKVTLAAQHSTSLELHNQFTFKLTLS